MKPSVSVDVLAALAYIASGGLAAVADLLADILPRQGAHIMLASSALIASAGLLTRLFNNRTPATPVPPERSTP